MGDKGLKRVLLIEDNPADTYLLRTELEELGLGVLVAENGERGMDIAINQKPDAVLLDVVLPDMDGVDICRQLKSGENTSIIPVILMAGGEHIYEKISGLNAGAVDYISKPLDTMEVRLRIKSVVKNLQLEQRVRELTSIDEITSLANRKMFFEVLEREVLHAKMKGNPLTMMMLDVDNFKSVNDTYGHLVGDGILKEMGQILMENLYPMDIPVRYGGDEFAVLMAETSSAKAVLAAEKLRKIIDEWHWKTKGSGVAITVSIGLASIDSLDSRELIRKAEQAISIASKRGGNCTVCWDAMQPREQVNSFGGEVYQQLQSKISDLSERLRTEAFEVLSAFLKAMATKDPFIANHAENTVVYALAIAEEMGLSEELKGRLRTAAILHDLGKIGVPDGILQKTDSLTSDEMETIRKHVLAGVEILKPLGIFSAELPIIRQHHERLNGEGYPDGLRGKAISIGARVLAVADSFDAITSERAYRGRRTFQEALKEIEDCAGTQFDVDVVNAFKRACQVHLAEWPLPFKSGVATGAEEMVYEAVYHGA